MLLEIGKKVDFSRKLGVYKIRSLFKIHRKSRIKLIQASKLSPKLAEASVVEYFKAL